MTDNATDQAKKPSAEAISRWENEGGATQEIALKLPDAVQAEARYAALNKIGK